MLRIFISYRRVDSQAISDRIHEYLTDGLGDESIFKDVNDIPFGADFRSVLSDEIAKADVVLVIVGQSWGAEMKSRLDRVDDFVRIELESALKQRKRVVPVLVNGAKMPPPDTLPRHLQNIFPFLNAIEVGNDPRFKSDIERLIQILKNWQALPLPPVMPELPKMTEKPAPTNQTGMWIAAIIALVVLALIGVIALSTMNNKETQTVVVQATDMPTAEATTVIAEPTQTTEPTLTPTVTPTATETEVPLTRNADWTVVTQEIDGVSMVTVPKGCFIHQNEQTCVEAFLLDTYEVTQAQFDAFGGKSSSRSGYRGDNLPVQNIIWTEAQAYCELRGMRLPTLVEYTYAAQGVENLTYPWGNDFNASNVVYGRNASSPKEVTTVPTSVSWVGAYHLVGNVWEWASDTPNEARAYMFGGGYATIDLNGTTTDDEPRAYLSPDVGFRCAKDAS